MGFQDALMGSMIAGTITQAGGSLAAGFEQSRFASYNASVAKMLAKDAVNRGDEEELRHRQAVQGLIGTQRAGFAAQGVDVNDGSALEVQQDTAELGALDAITIRNNAAREAFGFKTQGAIHRYQGRNAMWRSLQSSGGTVLGGVTDAAVMKYYLSR